MTGSARFVSIKNPLFRGGGRIFGPEPRFYGFKLNKKVKQLARKSALSYKAQAGKILLFDKFDISEPKTKLFAGMLKAVGLNPKKAILFVRQKKDSDLHRAGKNVENVNFSCSNDVNTLEVAGADTLVFSLDSLSELVSIHKEA
jgi:large subunit ribosomal protein L4